MYTIKTNINTIKSIKEGLGNEFETYNALKDNKYYIFYSYDDISEDIVYEAVLKDPNEPYVQYLLVKITPIGELDPNGWKYTDSGIRKQYIEQFYCYIVENDKALYEHDKDALDEKYKPIHEKISDKLMLIHLKK